MRGDPWIPQRLIHPPAVGISFSMDRERSIEAVYGLLHERNSFIQLAFVGVTCPRDLYNVETQASRSMEGGSI
jgi:hypothetical protein